MAAAAKKTKPALWEKVKEKVTRGGKGGKPGQWSARKAQLATADYKKAGGGYAGGKRQDNSLAQWTREEWGTKSGEESGRTGERYLPKQARAALSKEDYARTTEKKRADTKRGKQHSAQPKEIARKTARARTADSTPAEARVGKRSVKTRKPGGKPEAKPGAKTGTKPRAKPKAKTGAKRTKPAPGSKTRKTAARRTAAPKNAAAGGRAKATQAGKTSGRTSAGSTSKMPAARTARRGARRTAPAQAGTRGATTRVGGKHGA